MAKTDGYITDDPDGDWRFSNTGGEGRGDVTNAFGDAYARIERETDGAIAGTLVDGNGAVKAGAKVLFNQVDGLLSANPPENVALVNDFDEARKKLYIKWAGVSPMSLREVLIVWSTNIALLNKNKIKLVGGPLDDEGNPSSSIESISVSGRLMVVAMNEPIAIDGEEKWTFSIDAGAVAYYSVLQDAGPAPDPIDQEAEEAAEGEEEEPEEGAEEEEGDGGAEDEAVGGELADLGDPQEPCPCTEVQVGDATQDPERGQNTRVKDPLVFCKLCDDDDIEVESGAVAVTNRTFPLVPVRCTHPFMLVQLKICGCEPDCCDGGDNTFVEAEDLTNAPVWLASYQLYGSTLPLEVFTLDQLRDIDPCDMRTTLRGVLNSDVDCPTGGGCPPVTVDIVTNAGPSVSITGVWRSKLAGYAGQAAEVNYLCKNVCPPDEPDCVNPCDSSLKIQVDSEDHQCWVEEEILKPQERTIPVTHFDSMIMVCTNITVPQITTEMFTVVTECLTKEVELLTDIQAAVINLPTAINNTTITVPVGIGTQTLDLVTNVDTKIFTAVTDVVQEIVTLVTDVETSVITGPIVNAITSIATIPIVKTEVVDVFTTSLALPTDFSVTPEDIFTGIGSITSIVTGVEKKNLSLDSEFVSFRAFPDIAAIPTSVHLATGVEDLVVTLPTEVNVGRITVPVGAGNLVDNVFTTNLNVVEGVQVEVVTIPTGTGSLVESVANTTIAQVDNVLETSVEVALGGGEFPPQVVESFGTIGITFCDNNGDEQVVTVVTDLVLGDIPSLALNVVTQVATSPTPVVTDVSVVPAGTTVVQLVTGVQTTPTQIVTDVGLIAASTTEIDIVTNIGTGVVTIEHGFFDDFGPHLITNFVAEDFSILQVDGTDVNDVDVVVDAGSVGVGVKSVDIPQALETEVIDLVTDLQRALAPTTEINVIESFITTPTMTVPKAVSSGVVTIPNGALTTTFELPQAVDVGVVTVPTSVQESVFEIPKDPQFTAVNLITAFNIQTCTFVTECLKDTIDLVKDDGEIEIEILRKTTAGEDPDSPITMITEAPCNEDSPYKLLKRPDDVLQCVIASRTLADCCDDTPSCNQVTTPYETGDCTDLILLSPIPVGMPTAASSVSSCPCFTCEPELPCDDPGGNEGGTLIGGVCRGCTVHFKRLQRDNCKTCNPG